MQIERLTLHAFRNATEAHYNLSPGVTVIVGPNASGKTVLLEAITYLSRGKSPRASQDKMLLQWGQAEGKVRLKTLSQAGVYQQLEARFHQSEAGSTRVQFRLNDKPLKSRSEIIGRLPTVTFFANDLLLLRGAPEDRRQLLDQAITQYDPVYFECLKTYHHVRAQKAAILKQWFEQPQQAMLDILNQQLIAAGVAVLSKRLGYLAHFLPKLQAAYAHIADVETEPIDLRYHATIQSSSLNPGFVMPLDAADETLAAYYAEAIQRETAAECRRGQVLVGPHRDDIQFLLAGHDAADFASQGQQRSVVLAFKSAELQCLRSQLGEEAPVLLLDDVMAELDTKRQAALLSMFSEDLQVLMTTTHLDQTLPLLHDLTYHVIEVASAEAQDLHNKEEAQTLVGIV